MRMALGRGREARRDAAYAALMGGDLAGRLGAVYALVELADEWLGEVSLPVGVRRGHVQGVIDRLCAYLRSPLSTAADNGPAGESAGAQGRIQQAIVEEIHRRVQHPVASAEGASLVGTWSGFAFNFSGAVFVCTVNFTGSRWEHEVDFSDCIFMRDALFSCSTFAGTANFAHSSYRALADFSESLYQDAAYFGGCTWGGAANFSGCTFRAGTYFLGCRYGADTIFTGCSFASTVVRLAKLRQKVTQRREQLADKPAGSASHRRAARRLEQAHEAFARWAHGLATD